MLRRRPNAPILSGLAILAAVVTYRLFNLMLVSVPSLFANRLLHPSLAR